MSNTSDKKPWMPVQPFSRSQQTRRTHDNITWQGNNVTRPLHQQEYKLLRTKQLQELYNEAYLLLKDVIKVSKSKQNTTNSDVYLKEKSKDVSISNKTSSSKHFNLVGQSPLPPFKTRQRNSDVRDTNSNAIPNFSTSKQIKNESTVNQINFNHSLLGKNWIHNRTKLGAISLKNRTEEFFNNSNEWNHWKRKTAVSSSLSNTLEKPDINSKAAFEELKVALKILNAKNKSHERNELTRSNNDGLKILNDSMIKWNTSNQHINNKTRGIRYLDNSYISDSTREYSKTTFF